ncbi:hypothetical protein FPOAC1_007348 [Fusarium poae]|uniref:hypothetical protein n=1 Tax=Fusarium poae TaxID=36050 RepID=UPI001CE840FE|nr:hypothetical protein FPOAC1_007348 [Fusarium poae]KAG8674029.1 hypothetical protein FPOAC1_007348 [Fusarium poae]
MEIRQALLIPERRTAVGSTDATLVTKRIVLHSEKQGQRERCKGTLSGLWESWGLREEWRKIGERTDRFLGKYDVDFKSSANLGPTASNPKAQKTVCWGWAGLGGPDAGG